MKHSSELAPTSTRIEMTDTGPIVVSPAETVLRKLRFNTPNRRILEIARAAIHTDPAYPRSYMVAGSVMADRERELLYYSDAVRLGTELWRPYAVSHPVQWWDDAGTQDYLASIFHKGRVLFELGYEARAKLHFELLIALDPSDHLGVTRYFDNLQSYSEIARYMEPGGADAIQEERPRFVLQ